MTLIWYYLLGMNVLAFLLYGIDKRRAVKDRWRIPEATFLELPLQVEVLAHGRECRPSDIRRNTGSLRFWCPCLFCCMQQELYI